HFVTVVDRDGDAVGHDDLRPHLPTGRANIAFQARRRCGVDVAALLEHLAHFLPAQQVTHLFTGHLNAIFGRHRQNDGIAVARTRLVRPRRLVNEAPGLGARLAIARSLGAEHGIVEVFVVFDVGWTRWQYVNFSAQRACTFNEQFRLGDFGLQDFFHGRRTYVLARVVMHLLQVWLGAQAPHLGQPAFTVAGERVIEIPRG